MPKRFQAAYVELTNLCNRHCPFCRGTTRPPGFMDVSLFAGLAPELSSLARMAYLHVMGEALLHPELPEIARLARNSGLPLGMTTNGTLFASSHAHVLLEPPFRQLNISLHSGGSADDLENILDFADSALKRNRELCVNLRLWDVCAENAESLRRISERCQKPLKPERNRHAEHLGERLSVHFDSAFEWPDLCAPETGKHGFCHGGIDQFAILCDGQVTACCLDADGVLSFGRCPEKSLKEILFCREFEQMRNGFHRGEVLLPLCRHCSYRNRFPAKKSRPDSIRKQNPAVQ